MTPLGPLTSLDVAPTKLLFVLVLSITKLVFSPISVTVPRARRLLAIPGEGMNTVVPFVVYSLETESVFDCDTIILVVVHVRLTSPTKLERRTHLRYLFLSLLVTVVATNLLIDPPQHPLYRYTTLRLEFLG